MNAKVVVKNTIFKAFVKTYLERTIIEVIFFIACYEPIGRNIFLFRNFQIISYT